MSARAAKAARMSALVLGLCALYVMGRASGLEQYFQPERLRDMVVQAGPWGPMLFVVLFIGAVVAQVPGVVFVVAAPALFSLPTAWLLCFVAANASVIANFELVRRVGGQPLGGSNRPWLDKLFASLDERPVRTVAVLRVVTIMFPPVTGALALTQVSARDHALGSALGMLLPITLILGAAGWLLG